MKKAVALIFLFAVAATAQIPARIEGTYIQDHANVLTPEQRQALETKVRSVEQSKHIQFGIVTVPTLGGQDIKDYSLAVARSYGIGGANGEHRGLMILLVTQDRKWRIEISRHLEGYMSDGQTGTVGRSQMVPYFKNGDWNGGLNAGVDGLLALAQAVPESEAQDVAADQKPIPTGGSGVGWLWLIFPGGLVIALIGYFVFRRRDETPTPAYMPTAPRPSTTRPSTYRPSSTPAPAQRVRPRESSYTPAPSRSYESDSSSYGSSSSSGDSSSSFGGSSDFGGGGSDGSF